MHGEMGSSRIEENLHAANWEDGPVQEVIPPVGEMSFRRFQAVPHYGYMKLKMPGPNGIITLASDPDIALRAENKTASLALEALSEALAAEELTALRSTVNRDDVILDKRSKSTTFKPADKIVKFQVHPTVSGPRF